MFDDPVDDLEKALDKIVAARVPRLDKAVEDVYDELDEHKEAQAVRLAHVLQELREVQEAVADLQEGHGAMADDLWPLVKQDRQSRQTDGQRAGAPDRLEEALADREGEGTRRVRQLTKARQAVPGAGGACAVLAKSLCPQADEAGTQRLAQILTSWFGEHGGQTLPYDRETAARLKLTKAATDDELQRWQHCGRLPDWTPLGKAWTPSPHEVDSLRYKWYIPGQQSSATGEEVPASVQQEQRRSQVARMLKNGWNPAYDADLASRLVLGKALSQEEAHGWHRTGKLELYNTSANVDVQRPVGPAIAALLLPGSALGRSAVREPGYGHSTVQRQAAQRVQDLARLAQMGR